MKLGNILIPRRAHASPDESPTFSKPLRAILRLTIVKVGVSRKNSSRFQGAITPLL
jgi:hypothetical protein